MRISTKGEYGVRALIELSHRWGQGTTQSAEIAARQHIPEPYLDQLLTTLRKAGFIRSVRGPQGGHALLHAPEEIKLSRRHPLARGIAVAGVASARRGLPVPRGARGVAPVETKTAKILDGVSIADLAAREREFNRNESRYAI